MAKKSAHEKKMDDLYNAAKAVGEAEAHERYLVNELAFFRREVKKPTLDYSKSRNNAADDVVEIKQELAEIRAELKDRRKALKSAEKALNL